MLRDSFYLETIVGLSVYDGNACRTRSLAPHAANEDVCACPCKFFAPASLLAMLMTSASHIALQSLGQP
jgi:hypothetical protein